MGDNAVVRKTVVVAVAADLSARARLDGAAGRAGVELVTVKARDMTAALRAARADLLVLDLDEGREQVLEQLAAARAEGVVPDQVVGYFSHVDEDLGAAAQQSGCAALPRGRFWRTVEDLFRSARRSDAF